MSGLTTPQIAYKPFRYPQAFEYWKRQQQLHWLPEEVPLADDVKNFRQDLTPQEVNLLTQIFRFFTQSDIEVADNYHQRYMGVFKPIEVQMMLSAFANMETIHVAAYSHLLDTIGMPEAEYSAFLRYKAMKEKFDYMHSFKADNPHNVALTMAAFGAFTEGLQLFASFAILLNFPRFNKMKGMGQIVTWSVRDETLHCEGIIWLFKEWLKEHPDIRLNRLAIDIYQVCRTIVEHEDAFIDLAFEMGEVQGLKGDDVKGYIRYIADRRLKQLGLKPLYNHANPLPWLDQMLNGVEHANFFEQRATEYSKAALKGQWSDVWASIDAKREQATAIE
jgi:ribonucleoside-diphosphate reductase beta chain